MFRLVFLLLIVVPIVEFYVLVQVADGLGWIPSIVLLLAVSMIGASLMKWQSCLCKLKSDCFEFWRQVNSFG